MASFVPYFVAAVLLINTATALECYKCNTNDNVACGWGITSFTYDTEKCDGNFVASAKCFKITATNKEGKEYIARGCYAGPSIACPVVAKSIGWAADISSSDPQSLHNLNCDVCETDKCNSASKLAGFTFLGVLLAAFAFLF